MIPALSSSAVIHYTVSVLNPDGSTAHSLPRKRNLILDQGLNAVAVRPWHENIQVAALGTKVGPTPTKRDSGTITLSRTGSTVTASAGFFVAADVGRLIKWDTGEEAYISAYSSGTSVTTSTSGTIAASEGTVWYVNQTGLEVESNRTDTYGTDTDANTITYTAGTITDKRTFIGRVETGTITYTEVGWSYTTTPGNNLFGRDVLAGSGVTVTAGQQVKIVLELTLALDPTSPTALGAITPPNGGTATAQFENLDYDQTAEVGTLNPYYATTGSLFVGLSSATDAFKSPALGDGAGNLSESVGPSANTRIVYATAESYSAGSFELNFSGYFGLNDGNIPAGVNCIFWGFFSALNTAAPVYRVRFSTTQSKTSAHSWNLTFKHTWGRTLVN